MRPGVVALLVFLGLTVTILCLLLLIPKRYKSFFITDNSAPVPKELTETFNNGKDAMKETGLPFMLAYGTAIGAYRQNDLIPYDNDVDFAIHYKDLPRKANGDIDHSVINNAMKKNGFKIGKKSSPFEWECDGKKHPVLYRYRNKKTTYFLDVSILYSHHGFVWEYAEGGERTGKGRRFSQTPTETATIRGEQFQAFPQTWLDTQYGNWRVPNKGDSEAPSIKVTNDSQCILPPP